MSRGPLLHHLGKLKLIPVTEPEEEICSEASWDLAGESVLQGKIVDRGPDGWVIKLVYGNVYGPVEGVTISTRAGDPDKPTAPDAASQHSDWREQTMTEEWLNVDAERISRQAAREPICDETPWEAVYEWRQSIKPRVLEIWVRSPSENINWVLADWEMNQANDSSK